VDEHAREPERHLFGVLFALLRDFKAVALGVSAGAGVAS
jgi:hypothetical protein